MNKSYHDEVKRYRELAARAAEGDAQARKDKAKAMNTLRAMEREAAREGQVWSLGVKVAEGPTKRSLQEDYIRRHDDKRVVEINGVRQTLREFHSRRLLGK